VSMFRWSSPVLVGFLLLDICLIMCCIVDHCLAIVLSVLFDWWFLIHPFVSSNFSSKRFRRAFNHVGSIPSSFYGPSIIPPKDMHYLKCAKCQ
jgi:hypothetical protein